METSAAAAVTPEPAPARPAAADGIEVIEDLRNPDSPGATVVVNGTPVIRITRGDGESEREYRKLITHARLVAAETVKQLTPADPLG